MTYARAYTNCRRAAIRHKLRRFLYWARILSRYVEGSLTATIYLKGGRVESVQFCRGQKLGKTTAQP